MFVSSHLMSEMALTADHLVVIGCGALIAETSAGEFVRENAGFHVRAQSPQAGELAQLLTAHGASVRQAGDGALAVTGMDRAEVGELAAAGGLVLHELTVHEPSLEAAYMQLTHDAVDYRAACTPAADNERQHLA